MTSVIVATSWFFASNVPVRAAGCADILGKHVILASDAIDPNVFVWDERRRLINYAAGVWQSARGIYEHTLLEKPGTRAYVVSCHPRQVRVRYSSPGGHDAVGLHLLSGPDFGRYGWALGDDVHILR